MASTSRTPREYLILSKKKLYRAALVRIIGRRWDVLIAFQFDHLQSFLVFNRAGQFPKMLRGWLQAQ
jgi:hypothetical protein